MQPLTLDEARTKLAGACTKVAMAAAEVGRLSAARAEISARMHKLEIAIRDGDVSQIDALECARSEHAAIERREAIVDFGRHGAERLAADARQALREAEARAAIPEVERHDATVLSAWRAFVDAFAASKAYRRSHGHAVEGQTMTRALDEDAARAGLATPRLRGAP